MMGTLLTSCVELWTSEQRPDIQKSLEDYFDNSMLENSSRESSRDFIVLRVGGRGCVNDSNGERRMLPNKWQGAKGETATIRVWTTYRGKMESNTLTYMGQ